MNNLEDTAAFFDVAPNTVRAWIRQGCPVAQHADKSRGVPWQLDFAALADWRIAKAVVDSTTRTQDANGNLSREEADRRRAVAQAIVAEVEADEMVTSFVLREDADRVTKYFLDSVKEGMAPVADLCAVEITRMTDPNLIRAFCEKAFNDAFIRAEAVFAHKCEAD